MSTYRHTQMGYATIIVMVGAMLAITVLMVALGLYLVCTAVLIVLGAVLAFFSSLTVEIGDGVLEIRFGPGAIGKRFPLADIESCRSVRNPWYYGLGIHITPQGWLYNVSGSLAVEIRMRSGARHRIGTDVPAELEAALRESIGGSAGDRVKM